PGGTLLCLQARHVRTGEEGPWHRDTRISDTPITPSSFERLQALFDMRYHPETTSVSKYPAPPASEADSEAEDVDLPEVRMERVSISSSADIPPHVAVIIPDNTPDIWAALLSPKGHALLVCGKKRKKSISGLLGPSGYLPACPTSASALSGLSASGPLWLRQGDVDAVSALPLRAPMVVVVGPGQSNPEVAEQCGNALVTRHGLIVTVLGESNDAIPRSARFVTLEDLRVVLKAHRQRQKKAKPTWASIVREGANNIHTRGRERDMARAAARPVHHGIVMPDPCDPKVSSKTTALCAVLNVKGDVTNGFKAVSGVATIVVGTPDDVAWMASCNGRGVSYPRLHVPRSASAEGLSRDRGALTATLQGLRSNIAWMAVDDVPYAYRLGLRAALVVHAVKVTRQEQNQDTNTPKWQVLPGSPLLLDGGVHLTLTDKCAVIPGANAVNWPSFWTALPHQLLRANLRLGITPSKDMARTQWQQEADDRDNLLLRGLNA
ncbi:hypothetical protein KIPB_011050, partial [Kipferlia bialata]